MIYTPKLTEDGYKKLHDIPSAYYCCSWVDGEDQIRVYTKEDGAIEPPSYPNANAIFDGFATLESDGYDYFLQVIKDKGKFIPDTLK